MHAFLLIGKTSEDNLIKAKELAKQHNSKLIDFPLSKIEDVRELTKFCKLSYTESNAIYIQNIENASTEAANAFLKLLEEPQENILFILTANNLGNVLSTIVSRCEVVRIKNQELRIKNQELEGFLNLNKIEKLAYVDKFKKKEEAIDFLENLISSIHQNLKTTLALKGEALQDQNAELGKHTLRALKAIKANGNVSIQLTNFAING